MTSNYFDPEWTPSHRCHTKMGILFTSLYIGSQNCIPPIVNTYLGMPTYRPYLQLNMEWLPWLDKLSVSSKKGYYNKTQITQIKQHLSHHLSQSNHFGNLD